MRNEDDYLSAAFLDNSHDDQQTQQQNNLNSYARKRLKKELDHLQSQPASKKAQKQEELQSVLHAESVLSQTNKGFQMMQKMGFKKGETLGVGDNGLAVPIQVQVKNDRKGLGTATTFLTAAQRAHMQSSLEKRKERFQESSREKTQKRQLERDIQVARNAVRDLDEKAGKCEKTDLWPVIDQTPTLHHDPGVKYITEAQEGFNTLELEDQMDILTEYLRSNYLYCQWCGIEFEDENDMDNNCPGDDRRDHDDD